MCLRTWNALATMFDFSLESFVASRYTRDQITALQFKASPFPEDLFSIAIIERGVGKALFERIMAQESGFSGGMQQMGGAGIRSSRQMPGLSRSDSGNLQQRWPKGEAFGGDQPRSPRGREGGRLSRQSSLRDRDRDRDNWTSGNKDAREGRLVRQESRTGIDGDAWGRKPLPPPPEQQRYVQEQVANENIYIYSIWIMIILIMCCYHYYQF